MNLPNRTTTNWENGFLRWIESEAPIGIIVTDVNLIITFCNKWIEERTGRKKGSLLQRSLFDCFSDLRKKEVQPLLEEVLEGRSVVLSPSLHTGLLDVSLLDLEGTRSQMRQFVMISPLLDDRREVLGIVLIIQDVTERFLMEKWARESERFFGLLIEYCADIIMTLDPSGVILYASPSLYRILGYNPLEVARKKLPELLHPEDAPLVHERFRDLLENVSNPSTWTMRVLHAEGTWKSLETIGTAHQWAKSIVRIVINARDVTERLEMEKQIARSRRLEALEVLAGGIAHDFNNLLGVVLGNISMAQAELKAPNESPRVFLEEAENAVKRAAELTKKFLALSKAGIPNKALVDIENLVQDLMRKAALPTSKLTVTTCIEKGLPRILMDEGQISQAIDNVLSNAVEAMPNGGTLEVHVRNVVREAKRWIEISVKDSGVGIPPEDVEKVFDPYFSTKQRGSEKGMGLGLTLVDSVVQKHGGWVEVESQPEVGTTVHIFLPAEESTQDT